VCIVLCRLIAHIVAQNRADNFPSYPPDNHHCSDDVYLREGVSNMPEFSIFYGIINLHSEINRDLKVSMPKSVSL